MRDWLFSFSAGARQGLNLAAGAVELSDELAVCLAALAGCRSYVNSTAMYAYPLDPTAHAVAT